jgi:hypothetical protein
MKWVFRVILVLLLIPFFVPEEGSRELRNLPVLIAIVAFFLLCIAYRLVCMSLLWRRVRSVLLRHGYTARRTRCSLYTSFVLAENRDGKLSICLLLRKRRFYRYHFVSPTQIEFWATSFWVATRNRSLGLVARGATFHSILGGQRLAWQDAEGEATRILLMDKMPNRVTDASPESGELVEGDALLRGDVTLLTPEGLSEYLLSFCATNRSFC